MGGEDRVGSGRRVSKNKKVKKLLKNEKNREIILLFCKC